MNKRKDTSLPTLKDVARESGVSAITVSRCFRHPELVSAEVRARVMQVVDRLGYVPNSAASALASRRTGVICLLLPSLSNNVYVDVVNGAYDRAYGTAHTIQIGNHKYSPLEEEKLVRVFLQQNPAGLIVAGGEQTGAARDLLERADCRVVQIMDSQVRPIDLAIGLDHERAGADAVEGLLARGYCRIGFLGARMDARSQKRLQGYRNALFRAGADERVSTSPSPSSARLGALLLSDLLARHPDTDAVFTNNDDIALGAYLECQRRGMRLPDAFGICGFNDLDLLEELNPPLSTVRTDRYQMGWQSVDRLIALANTDRPTGSGTVDLGYACMWRGTTRPAPATVPERRDRAG